MIKDTARLCVSCPDKQGIIARISSNLAQNRANILQADQFSDPRSGRFYMRVEWDLDGFAPSLEEWFAEMSALAKDEDMRFRLRRSRERLRTAIFVSKFDHCLWDLLLRQRAGELELDIACIVSNHPDLARVAYAFDLPFHHIAVEPGKKDEAEARAMKLLSEQRVELVVLARYMQILSAKVVEAFPHRVINIHHSFLPAFKGAKPYHQAYDRGVKMIGATAHFVTEDLDQGPIIAQDVAHVSHRDDVESLKRLGRDLEKVVLARAVRWYAEDRIMVDGQRTVVFG